MMLGRFDALHGALQSCKDNERLSLRWWNGLAVSCTVVHMLKGKMKLLSTKSEKTDST